MSSATERLRKLLDERGAEYETLSFYDATWWNDACGLEWYYGEDDDGHTIIEALDPTPEQAIAATLGREPWVNPTWERWHKSLRHDEIKSIGDAVQQLMYEAIEFGGDMGPNGNTYNGIDEGDVLTAGFINEWVARFEATLGSGTCHEVEDEDTGFIVCSECGAVHDENYTSYYCWCCGRKVVDE